MSYPARTKEGIGASWLNGSDKAALNEYPHGSVVDDVRILSHIRYWGARTVFDGDTADESGRRGAGGTTAESKRNNAQEA